MKRSTLMAILICCTGLLATCASPDQRVNHAPVLQGTIAPLDPDNETDFINYTNLEEQFGPVPQVDRSYRIGIVLKFFGNQYWQLLAEGVQSKANELNVVVDIHAAATETDPAGQRQVMEEMLKHDYDAFIISPQTDDNLIDLVAQVQREEKVVLVVNEIVQDARYWVGPNQYESGVRAATYLEAHLPENSKVAVIEGLPDAYAARQRTRGFHDTLEGSSLRLVASVPANWDAQQASEAAVDIIKAHPDIRGFYCNNDVMALGVIAALDDADRLDDILVIGTDGIAPAYDAIRAGDLTATVDSFPTITGEIALEIVVRLLEGQPLPRVVYSPQNLVDAENVDQPAPPSTP